jgi:histidinol-phosphate/aromatic aminotransferase/cobyric acid decarboxylase-like protein
MRAIHGGDFWKVWGEEFQDLEDRSDIVPADVLDAWFEPSPRVIEVLSNNVAWMCRTSPPTHAEGFRRTISRVRGIAESALLTSSGSSTILFQGLPLLIKAGDRALILDPTYGEYSHVLENTLQICVERFALQAESGFEVDFAALMKRVTNSAYKLVALVNPNSPTGSLLSREQILELCKAAPETMFWIDETYVDYASTGNSVETDTESFRNLIVCKSMSKAYALSGLRVAYACGPPDFVLKMNTLTPPWAISLPGQLSGVYALLDESYYLGRWALTRELRHLLAKELNQLRLGQALEGAANFIMLMLDPRGPTALEVKNACESAGVFVREIGSMGETGGAYSLRIAVRSAEENRRIVTALESASLFIEQASHPRSTQGPWL